MGVAAIKFEDAVREGLFARIAIIGPSGSGKTMSGLKILRALCGDGARIAVIETEHRSANKYVGVEGLQFKAVYLEDFCPQNYIDCIYAAAEAGIKGLLIDSLTHAWAGKGGALEMVDAAKARSRDNSYAAWRTVTPLHNQLVETMLGFPGHLIVAMRSKMQYVLEEYTDAHGNKKTKPIKVGLQPIQRDGLEYEFDVIGDIDLDHNFVVSKTRFPSLDGKVFHKPGADVAKLVRDWLDGAVATPEPVTEPETTPEATGPIVEALRANIKEAADARGFTDRQVHGKAFHLFALQYKQCEPEQLQQILDAIEAVPIPGAIDPPEPESEPDPTPAQEDAPPGSDAERVARINDMLFEPDAAPTLPPPKDTRSETRREFDEMFKGKPTVTLVQMLGELPDKATDVALRAAINKALSSARKAKK